ncbi:MAG: hydantoinase B/oxoprolinase family protein [Candidatus Tectomicrobia bacterium]|nr:hydantoinase B/oxoprolinase family protein [Candidatus Tectomicrobia bacterium]
MANTENKVGMDPITFEVLKNAYMSMCNEGTRLIERVAYGPVITEGHDYSVSLLTKDGRIVAHGPNDLAPHFGTFEASMRYILASIGGAEKLKPGDVYCCNEPYTAGTHAQDIRFVRPVFYKGELVAITMALCHWTDVGGPMPGSFNPKAVECFAEGLQLPAMKIYENDEPVRHTFELIRLNVRVPHDRMGDIAAQYQAVRQMERRMCEYVERYGLATIWQSFEEIMDYTERLFRAEVETLPDGSYEFVDYVDQDEGQEGRPPVKVHCVMSIAGSDVTFDWSGSDPVRGPSGVTLPACHSATFNGTLNMFPHLLPLNNGIIRSIKVVTKPGTVTHVVRPTPVAGYCSGAYEKVNCATMGVWAKAFATVNPKQITCGTVNLQNCVTGGVHPKTKAPYVSYVWLEGGQGAHPDADGNSFAMMMYAGGASNQPCEIHERWYPLRYTAVEAVQDSCGDGKFRGGYGIRRDYEMWGDGVLSIHGDRAKITPFGLAGGSNGGPNQLILNPGAKNELNLGMYATGIKLKAGDRLAFSSNGGGGFGNPLEREPRGVLEDVIDEFLSLHKARDVYGVAIRVIDKDLARYEIDVEETKRLRAALAGKKRPTGYGPWEVHPYGSLPTLAEGGTGS